MDIKDSYLHGTVGVVKSISVAADKLSYKLADVAGTTKTVTMPTATQSANGLLSSTDKKKLDSITGPSLSIPYIVGPDTDTTKGTWTGSYSGITAYTDGLTIIYVPKVAGASTTTLNINGLGAKTCHYTGSSNLTTHYSVGTPILLTYVGGYWKRADYDSWTPYVAAYCATAAATAAKTASCSSYVLTSKTYIHMLITTANTAQSALTMNINSKGAKPIYINGAASSASNYTLPAGTYIVYYDGTNFYFRTDGVLPGTIEKATNATSASKVANNLVIKLKSGSTEDTDLYTYNGSAAKTLDIKQGTGITLTAAANALTITNAGVRSIATGTTNGTISVNTNGTSANVAVKGLGSAAYTTSGSYVQLGYIGTITDVADLYSKLKPYFGDNYVSITKLKDERGIWGHLLSKFQNPDLGLYGVDGCGLFLVGGAIERWSISGKNTTDDPLVYNKYRIFDAGNLGVVSSSDNGLAPKVINTNTATVGSAYYVLASTNGSATPSWYKLPATAFANDDTKVTQTNTTGSASYRVLFSGNANDTTETTTARKSANLLFNPSTGNLTATSLNLNGDIVINDGTNHDRYIKWLYANTDDYGWRIGYLGSQGSDNNDLTFDSHRKTEGWASALYFKHTTLNAHFAGIVNAPTFQGNLDGTYVNKLTGYTKSTSASNLAATDTLNTALGKLEYKAHYAYDWVIGVTKTDTDEYINKWSEIVGFLDSVKEGTDILDEFVTRKTDLTITGSKTFTASTNTFSGTGASILTIDRNSTNPAWIRFCKNGTLQGYIGITNDFQPVFLSGESGASNKILIHSGNYTSYTPILNSSSTHATSASVIYAPPTAGTKGLVLTSNGSGAPVWSNQSNIAAGSASKLTISDIRDTTPTPNHLADKAITAWFNNKDKPSTADTWYSGISVAGWSDGYRVWLLSSNSGNGTTDEGLFFRGGKNDTWSPWKQVAFTDGTVATANNGIFYIAGTGDTAGTWLGSHTGITSYYVGLTIAYKIPIAGASTTTLNINSLGAKTCYINTSKLTTHYGVGSVAILVYDGTYFRAADYWDGNSYAYVRQYTTDSTAAEYPLLFRYNTAAPTANGYVTEYTRYDSGITINPNTNTITATNFKGTATLIACTATTDNVTRPIVLTNTSSKLYYTTKATINYSTGNITAPTFTGNLIGNVTGNLTGNVTGKLNMTSITTYDNLTTDGLYGYNNENGSTDSNGFPTANSSTAIGWGKSNCKIVIAARAGTTSSEVYIKQYHTAWGSWYKLLHSGNYTSYTVKKDGTGASGTWGISITGSSASCTGNAATATTLKPTTIVSAKALSLSNASWTDTGYTFASLASGTYAVQVTSGTNLVASGIMSVYKNLSDTAGDEIPLHVYGTAGWRPYLRTYANKLLISSNDASATSRTVTIKIALIL